MSVGLGWFLGFEFAVCCGIGLMLWVYWWVVCFVVCGGFCGFGGVSCLGGGFVIGV